LQHGTVIAFAGELQPGRLKLEYPRPKSRPLDAGDQMHIRPTSNIHKKNGYAYQNASSKYNQDEIDKMSLPAFQYGESLATGRQAIIRFRELPASTWEISVATISSDRGSDIPPTPPPVESE